MQAGCSPEHYHKQQATYGYVFDVGSSKEIANWILSQQDPREVASGQIALSTIPGLRGKREADDAADGFLRVYKKLLEGWPGLRLPAAGRRGPDDWTLTDVLEVSRGRARLAAQNHPDCAAWQAVWKTIQQIDPNWMKE